MKNSDLLIDVMALFEELHECKKLHCKNEQKALQALADEIQAKTKELSNKYKETGDTKILVKGSKALRKWAEKQQATLMAQKCALEKCEDQLVKLYTQLVKDAELECASGKSKDMCKKARLGKEKLQHGRVSAKDVDSFYT